MKRTLSLVLTLMMALSLVAGCAGRPDATTDTATGPVAGSPATEEPAPEEAAEDYSETGTLNLSWPSDSGTELFPFPWASSNICTNMVFDSLIRLNSDGKTIVPKLAEKYTVSDDGSVYTFILREGVKWHDGEAVTPEDVVFSINGYIKSPIVEFPSIIACIEGGDAVMAGEANACTGITVNGNEITIKLSSPRNDFLTYLCIVAILPSHLLADKDPLTLHSDAEFLSNPVGCGPYQLETFNAGNYFTLVRNDDYYGAPAGIKHVTFTSYAQGGADATTAALIAGTLDFATGGVMNDINAANNIVANNPDVTMKIIPATYARYFVFNTAGSTDSRYNDDMLKPEVRQAINLLLDKEAIAAFYSGQATALTTFVNPGSPDYNSDIPLFKRDVETAKQMLVDAGFNFDRAIRIEYHYKDQTTADIIALITQNLSQAGIKVQSSMATGGIVDIIYEQRNWDLSYSGNYGLEPVDSFYYVCTTKNSYINKISADLNGIKASMFNPMYDEYFSTTDAARKTELLNQFQVEGNKNMFAAPLYVMNKIALTHSSKLAYAPELFTYDIYDWEDYRFDTWQLLEP